MISAEELEKGELFLKWLSQFRCGTNVNQSLCQPHEGHASSLSKILKASEKGKVTHWGKQLSWCQKRENDWDDFLPCYSHGGCGELRWKKKKNQKIGWAELGDLKLGSPELCLDGTAKIGRSLAEMPGPSPWTECLLLPTVSPEMTQ